MLSSGLARTHVRTHTHGQACFSRRCKDKVARLKLKTVATIFEAKMFVKTRNIENKKPQQCNLVKSNISKRILITH